jgi:hypothetical protein
MQLLEEHRSLALLVVNWYDFTTNVCFSFASGLSFALREIVFTFILLSSLRCYIYIHDLWYSSIPSRKYYLITTKRIFYNYVSVGSSDLIIAAYNLTLTKSNSLS